jgi:hypothetical protein
VPRAKIAIYGVVCFGLCLSPQAASAFPAANGSGVASVEAVTSKSVVTPVAGWLLPWFLGLGLASTGWNSGSPPQYPGYYGGGYPAYGGYPGYYGCGYPGGGYGGYPGNYGCGYPGGSYGGYPGGGYGGYGGYPGYYGR